jgi:magnesium-transporting ATPase (P-type)
MRIPADSIVIQGNNILVDESDLTGESDTRERSTLNYDN